jgi:hypothetical protein
MAPYEVATAGKDKANIIYDASTVGPLRTTKSE